MPVPFFETRIDFIVLPILFPNRIYFSLLGFCFLHKHKKVSFCGFHTVEKIVKTEKAKCSLGLPGEIDIVQPFRLSCYVCW